MSRTYEDGYLVNNCTSSSMGSRLNCTNSSGTPARKNYNFRPPSSPITVTTMPDGRVERRLETCSYQETEMVSIWELD